jgi:hypothetical protein
MDSLVAYQSFVADLDSQRVEKDQRVDRFQRFPPAWAAFRDATG